jgi:hypothetical protein
MKIQVQKITFNLMLAVATLAMLGAVVVVSLKPAAAQNFCTCNSQEVCGPGSGCRVGGCQPISGLFGQCASS